MPYHLIAVLFTFLLHTTCTMTTASDLKAPDIVYEVFIRSFCDSNGDGIGDIQGLISRLDYIRDLGATAIWIMPVHPSPSYHKYDVSDYYAIDPEYGTMADMEQLIAETHKRGMKLILDLVINHTSSDHSWFQQASSSADNPYRRYYVWRDYEAVKNEITKKSATFDSDNLTQWHEWPGNAERYYGFFWKGMPDLNFDHPPVRDEVYATGKFWLEKGIDGFRLDAAKHIYPDDRLEDTHSFWKEFTARMRAIRPDVLIVGEVWADPPLLARLSSGLPSLFNFNLSQAITEAIAAGDPAKLAVAYENIQQVYAKADPSFGDAILLSNHDMNRIRSELGGDMAKSRLAASILMTLPGTPYIYYGEELGMLGVKPDIHLREPFPWGDATFADTAWQTPVYSIKQEVAPLSEQIDDPGSIYQHYKKWIGLRKAYPSMSTGPLQLMSMGNAALLGYTVASATGTYWITHNLGDKEESILLMDDALIVSTGRHVKAKDSIMLPPYSSVVAYFGP